LQRDGEDRTVFSFSFVDVFWLALGETLNLLCRVFFPFPFDDVRDILSSLLLNFFLLAVVPPACL